MNLDEKRQDIETSLLKARHLYERAAAGFANQESGAKARLDEARDVVGRLENELADLDAAETYAAEEAFEAQLIEDAKDRKNAVKEAKTILEKRRRSFLEVIRLIGALGEELATFENCRNELAVALQPFGVSAYDEVIARLGSPKIIRDKLGSFMWSKGLTLKPSPFQANAVSTMDFDSFITQLNKNAMTMISED